MRTFDSGATRDTDQGKPEYAGFLSWEVLTRFGQYMHKHRFQKDGTLRASDNWKKGIPRDVYMESMFRHFMDLWAMHQSGTANKPTDPNWHAFFDATPKETLEETLCALLFNVQGYLYELMQGR